MGLGKTVVALAAIKKMSNKTLIVCPKYLIQNWKQEAIKFGADKEDITYINFAMLTKISRETYDFIIVDEAHYLKNPKAHRSQTFRKYLNEFPPEYLLLMTGTPCKNDVSEIFNLLDLCNVYHKNKKVSKFESNIWKFKRRYMEPRLRNFGRRSVKDFKGFINREEYIELCSKFMHRKKLDQVKLPDTVNQRVHFGDLSLDKEYIKLIDDFDDEAYMTAKKITAMRIAELTAQYLENFSDPVVVFSDHVDAVELIAKKLYVPFVHGGVSQKKRDETIELFKKGGIKFLVATYKTAGVGLTLTNAHYMVLNDLPFVPADLEQAKGRIHRIGQVKTCFYYYMGLSKMYFQLMNMLNKKTEILKDL